jgi:hypothetical protein
MDRLIYNAETKTIIVRISPCDDTITGTPFDMIEDTAENIDRIIVDLGLKEDALP